MCSRLAPTDLQHGLLAHTDMAVLSLYLALNSASTCTRAPAPALFIFYVETSSCQIPGLAASSCLSLPEHWDHKCVPRTCHLVTLWSYWSRKAPLAHTVPLAGSPGLWQTRVNELSGPARGHFSSLSFLILRATSSLHQGTQEDPEVGPGLLPQRHLEALVGAACVSRTAAAAQRQCPPGLAGLLVHLGNAAVLQDHVARNVQGHEVPQLLHEEAQHLARELELVVAGEAVAGDVQVPGGGQRSGPGSCYMEQEAWATITLPRHLAGR